MVLLRKRDGRALALVVLFAFLLVVYVNPPHLSIAFSSATSRLYFPSTCDISNALQDVFVLVKTGACEDPQRLVTQSRTSLACAPAIAYFSDLDETVGDIQLRDVVAGVGQRYVDSDDEFVLYTKLQREGSCKLVTGEDLRAMGPRKGNGNNENRGWNLDKWKFLPMTERAWSMRDDAKWYVEIEADTYVVWRNLLRFLALLDHTEDYYVGSPMLVAGVGFIYGGSGAVISQSAVRKVAEHIRRDNAALQEFTHESWAGDHVMGKALQDVGVGYTTMSREFVRDSVTGADYGFHWCTAALTFHHVTGQEATDFYDWEKAWFQRNPEKILRHRDVFQEHILPRFESIKDDWNNDAADEVEDDSHTRPRSFEECERYCVTKADCVQYRFADGRCFTGRVPRHGVGQHSQKSGWVLDRARDWARSHKSCTAQDEAWSPHG